MDKIIIFFTEISKVWWAILGGAISLTAYFILEKFKNRMSYFESILTYNSLGTSLSDQLFGDITIHHNSVEIKHLNYITVNIKNSSNTDFEDLHLISWVDNRSQILGWTGNYDDTKIMVNLEENYSTKLNQFNNRFNQFVRDNPDVEISNDLQMELDHYTKNKYFFLPVFNRGSSITLSFLVENFDGNIPMIQFPIQHKSVKVIPAINKDEKNNELGLAMFKYGYFVLSIYLCWFFFQENLDKNNLIIFAIISFSYLWIGLLIYKIKNYIHSILK